MTQEEKELLFRDLSARMTYGLKCYPVITNGKPNTIGGYRKVLDDLYVEVVGKWFPISMIKPYLRPISSMTDEEKGELKLEQEKDEELFIQVINKSQNGDDSLLGTVIPHYAEDWANKNHFDYRGLIEKGLALEAPDGMYNLNKE